MAARFNQDTPKQAKSKSSYSIYRPSFNLFDVRTLRSRQNIALLSFAPLSRRLYPTHAHLQTSTAQSMLVSGETYGNIHHIWLCASCVRINSIWSGIPLYPNSKNYIKRSDITRLQNTSISNFKPSDVSKLTNSNIKNDYFLLSFHHISFYR